MDDITIAKDVSNVLLEPCSARAGGVQCHNLQKISVSHFGMNNMRWVSQGKGQVTWLARDGQIGIVSCTCATQPSILAS